VTVDLLDRPTEGLPLPDHRLEIENLGHEVVELDLVVVEDHGEIVQREARLAELRSRHGRLPHLAFLHLAIAQDAVHAGGRRARGRA
jgi:hypothetical protein